MEKEQGKQFLSKYRNGNHVSSENYEEINMEKRYNLNVNKEIPMDVPEGYFVLAHFSTLAAYRITFELKDGDTVCYQQTRCSTNPLPAESAFFRSTEGKVVLSVQIPQSERVDARVNQNNFLDTSGNLVVRSINVVGEDADDEDYNDFIINVTVMKSGG